MKNYFQQIDTWLLVVVRFHKYRRIKLSETLFLSAILLTNICVLIFNFFFTYCSFPFNNVELVSGYVCGKIKEKTFSRNLSELRGSFEREVSLVT